jgi:hypothetical protein
LATQKDLNSAKFPVACHPALPTNVGPGTLVAGSHLTLASCPSAVSEAAVLRAKLRSLTLAVLVVIVIVIVIIIIIITTTIAHDRPLLFWCAPDDTGLSSDGKVRSDICMVRLGLSFSVSFSLWGRKKRIEHGSGI